MIASRSSAASVGHPDDTAPHDDADQHRRGQPRPHGGGGGILREPCAAALHEAGALEITDRTSSRPFDAVQGS